ncbi:CDP-glycerol glycerophosphotransferase family protein [Leucobacter soli]|uniref:Uncharacterized protein n=1 Tax=Leucobacter soli TaxID=2812850 RepID=A0A916NPS0_9MICO|nr:CDP-glycerol glycerophosphotransferase family protein [Leucobacter soli]CAG7617028.1 hypothetical protein LEUCIP111803_02053 [Leucobacter soli]
MGAAAVGRSHRPFRHDHTVDAVAVRRRSLRWAFRITAWEAGEFVLDRCYLRLESTEECVEIDAAAFERRPGLSGEARFDFPEAMTLTPLRYSVCADLRDLADGRSVEVRLTRMSEDLFARMSRRYRAPRLTLGDGRILTLNASAASTTLRLIVLPASEADRGSARQRVWSTIALMEAGLRRTLHLERRPTALLYEKEAATAQDNAFALFAHLLGADRNGAHRPGAHRLGDHRQGRVHRLGGHRRGRGDEPRFDFFYVMNRDSAQRARVAGLPRVVSKYSLKYWRLLASPSSFLLSSESRSHVGTVYAQPGLLSRLVYVRRSYFLGHGVTALKRVPLLNPGNASSPDVIVAASAWERDILIGCGFDPERIDITGLPRWDRLLAGVERRTGIERILYLPTWRAWLAGRDAVELSRTEYVRSIAELLTDPGLHALFEAHGCVLQFMPHPKVLPVLRVLRALDQRPGRIELVDQDRVEFGEVLRGADAFITDYSSVLWDVVQLQKPILLFPFDAARYDAEIGGYRNPQLRRIRRRFGTATTPAELRDRLARMLEQDPAVRAEEAEHLAARTFAIRDTENSRRVVERVAARLPLLTDARHLPSYRAADAAYQERQRRMRED